MLVAVVAAPKKRKKLGGPSYLIYETLNGRPLYYRGYRDVVTSKKKPAEIMGSSSLQAMMASLLLGYLSTCANREQYLLATNQFSIDISEANRLEGVGELRKVESRVNFVATKQQSDDQTVLKTDRPSMGSNFAFFQSQTKAQTRFTSSNEHHFVALANRMSMA